MEDGEILNELTNVGVSPLNPTLNGFFSRMRSEIIIFNSFYQSSDRPPLEH
jgi:hypothetical protein